MKVREIMGKPVIINPHTTVKDAAKKMCELNITTLMVIENDELIGMLSDGDIVTKFATSDNISKETTVREIMSSHLINADAEENIEYAVGLMVKNKIRRLPIVCKSKLVGILTLDYVAKHLPEIGVDSFF